MADETKLTADGIAVIHGTEYGDEYVWLPRAQAAVDAANQRAERAERLLRQDLKKRTERPDFKTYMELKHGTAGAILWALQNGEISRGKAAEALAEWAHGVEPLLPDLPDAIPDDVTPLNLLRERNEARADLATARETIRNQRAELQKLQTSLETEQRHCNSYSSAYLNLTEAIQEAVGGKPLVTREQYVEAVESIARERDEALARAEKAEAKNAKPADELAQLRAHIAGEPARTRTAVVAELRQAGDGLQFSADHGTCGPSERDRLTGLGVALGLQVAAKKCHNRADELEREAKEAQDAAR